jgi:hypothetical protein
MESSAQGKLDYCHTEWQHGVAVDVVACIRDKETASHWLFELLKVITVEPAYKDMLRTSDF